MSITRWIPVALWIAIGAAAAWFLVADLIFVSGRDPAEEGARWPGYLAHIASAVPVLLIAPLQFVGKLRRARPGLHRALGRAFLGSAMLSAVFAVYLGATMPVEGNQLSLMLFGTLWLIFSAIAWRAAVKRDFATHRQFVIRSFAISTSFLWLHLFQTWQDELFGLLEFPELRYVTRGWASLLLPFLAAETYLVWWPAARRVFISR